MLSFLALLPLLAAASPAINLPQLIDLRVEGAQSTIFEGKVLTYGHDVTTPSGGTHRCNGLNNNANVEPGATATSALVDAAKKARFMLDGTWYEEFEDFFITAIGGDTQTDTQFWGVLVNNKLTDVGGCQARVNTTDQVLWAYDVFNKPTLLELSAGQKVAIVGQSVGFKVTDAKTGKPVAGAEVNGETTNQQGEAVVKFNARGKFSIKAAHEDAIRSNAVVVNVI